MGARPAGVRLVPFGDNSIVGSGSTPEEALNEARKEGVESPFLLYVPEREVVYIYYVG